jgi:hypothetical protein
MTVLGQRAHLELVRLIFSSSTSLSISRVRSLSAPSSSTATKRCDPFRKYRTSLNPLRMRRCVFSAGLIASLSVDCASIVKMFCSAPSAARFGKKNANCLRAVFVTNTFERSIGGSEGWVSALCFASFDRARRWPISFLNVRDERIFSRIGGLLLRISKTYPLL